MRPNRTRMRLSSVLCLGFLMPSAAACSTGTETPDTVTITVDRSGGRVGPGGPLGELDIARGFVDGEDKVTFSSVGPPSVPTATSLAVPIGYPVKIAPRQILRGPQVRLPLDPARDLPTAAGRRATTANAFISVLSEDRRRWIPLPTTYDAGTGQLVATATHFSWFVRQAVDPARSFWSPTTTGVQAADIVIAARAGRIVAHTLSAGCNNREAHFEGRFYLADRPLSDGTGDTQYRRFTRPVPGTMRVVSSTEIVFRDRQGHLALFRVRHGATNYQWCHPD